MVRFHRLEARTHGRRWFGCPGLNRWPVGVMALDAAVEPALAAPVGDTFSVGTAGPIAVFLEMAAATYLKTLIDVDGFCPKTAKLVIIGLIVARQAPYLAAAVLQARGMSFFNVQVADALVGIHERVAIVTGVEKQLVDASIDGKWSRRLQCSLHPAHILVGVGSGRQSDRRQG